MKHYAALCIAIVFPFAGASAMTTGNTSETSSTSVPTPANQGGKVEAIYAGAGKMVISGVTYTYSPLHTVVTINGKRATISDVRVGEIVQFQLASHDSRQPAPLAAVSVDRR